MGWGGVLMLSKAQKSATAPTHHLLASVLGARIGSQDSKKCADLSGFLAALPDGRGDVLGCDDFF